MEKTLYDPKELWTGPFEGKVSLAHIYNLINKGTIPSIRIGARILIPKSWVDDFLAGKVRADG